MISGRVKRAPKKREQVAGPGTLYMIHVLTHATRTRLDDALRELDLSSFQFTVLSVLAEHENTSSSRLSRRFHVSPQSMGELIGLLDRKGLIIRREDETNRRILLLSLTDAGWTAVRRGQKVVNDLEAQLFRHVAPAEFERFRATLKEALATLRST